MKKNATVDADRRLEALLSEMPLEPSGDFARRACEACSNEILNGELARMPVVPSADFSDRVMAEILSEKEKNTFAFPLRFSVFHRALRVSVAGAVAVFAVCVGIFSLGRKSVTLNEQVASALDSDPELVRLATADEADFTLGELVAASQLLMTLNDNSDETSDFFAYYEN